MNDKEKTFIGLGLMIGSQFMTGSKLIQAQVFMKGFNMLDINPDEIKPPTKEELKELDNLTLDIDYEEIK